MKFGAVFPTTAIGDDPIIIRDFAQAAEDLGYSHLLIYDHPIGASHANRPTPFTGPYDENSPFHEPLVLMGYLAGVTKTIGLATGVLILPQRQTALVAKQATEIQNLSGGRLRLGVGTGWNYIEYSTLGAEFRGRGSRMDEQIDVLRRLWSEPLIDYTGKYHRIDRACLIPRPDKPIPIWMGGFVARAFDRAVEKGDGFIFPDVDDIYLEAARKLLESVEQSGRDPAAFGIETMINFTDGPEGWANAVDAWRKVAPDGYATFRTLYPRHLDMENIKELQPHEHIASLQSFMKQVMI